MREERYLIRGCSLFPHRGSEYRLGTFSRVLTITTAFQRSALAQLAVGGDPLLNVTPEIRGELEIFLQRLDSLGFINIRRRELVIAKRSLEEISESDIAVNQLRARSAPELAQSEWIDGNRDGGVSTLAARGEYRVELSGRSRVISILYSILLASGVTQTTFADRYWRSTVNDLDIGFGAITAEDLGGNFYEISGARRRSLSLMPIPVDNNFPKSSEKPALAIHFGDCDPEQLIEWHQKGIPHYLIQLPVGDEVILGPMVIAGKSPCNRCLWLYQRDNFGFSTNERIPLTAQEEFPAAVAHQIAAIVAQQAIHFIDSLGEGSTQFSQRNTGVGEITYINFQRLNEPQVVAIARHPLCGCDQ